MEAGLGERALEEGAGPNTLRRWSRSGMVSCTAHTYGESEQMRVWLYALVLFHHRGW